MDTASASYTFAPAEVSSSTLWYVAVFEILLYLTITLYIFDRFLTKYHVAEIKDNPNSAKKDISFLFSSAFEQAGLRRTDSFIGVISSQVAKIFLVYRTMFDSLFGSVSKIMEGQSNSINTIRNSMRPIQMYIRSASSFFYKRLDNIVIGSMYSYHKMRQLIRRSLSGFNLVFHSIEHTRNTLASIPNDPFVRAIGNTAGQFGRIYSGVNRLCFIDKTKCKLDDGSYRYMRDIRCGQRLDNGAIVKSTFTLLNTTNDTTYQVPDNDSVIQVSGSHLIYDKYENNRYRSWKFVRDMRLATKSSYAPSRWYSISTTTNTFQLGSHLFRDYEEVSNMPTMAFLMNLMQLQHLNPTISNNAIYAHPSQHVDHGLSEHTLVKMANGDWKPLSDIQLGDCIADPTCPNYGDYQYRSNSNMVTGIVELHAPIYTKYMWNGILCTGNSKVYETALGVWMNVEVSLSAKRMNIHSNQPGLAIPRPSDNNPFNPSQTTVLPSDGQTVHLRDTQCGLRHMITTSGYMILYDPVLDREVVWLDFEQVKEPIINDWITDRVIDELNYNEIKKSNYSSSASTTTTSSC
jgi:hypothetical protein